MRLKHVWDYIPLPNVKLFWDRITASRIATFYFIFSIVHCILQLVFQAQAFAVNEQAASFLYGLVEQGNATLPGFFVLGNKLSYCDHVPKTLSVASCTVVWNGSGSKNTSDGAFDAIVGVNATSSSSPTSTSSSTSSATQTSFTSSSSQPASPTLSATHGTVSLPVTSSSATAKTTITVELTLPTAAFKQDPILVEKRLFDVKPQGDLGAIREIQLNGTTGLSLDGFGYNHQNVTLDKKCLVALNWPVQMLDNTKREDVTFIGFQAWVLGMSLVAVLNESIPHLIATLLTHLSATAWGAFQIYATDAFHNDFKRLTTDGVCQINLLPNYWSSRANAEIPSLTLNAVALLVSCFLSYRLIKLFGWQTFKRVGASVSINRIYKLVLTLSIVIQLSLFFVVVTVALWLDQLYNGVIAVMATKSDLYQALLVVVLLLLIPWLLTGWFGARKESQYPMMVFLVLSALYLVGLALMFDSTTFRWTFMQWSFFAAIVTTSGLLILTGFVVGLICRVNFNKGLTRYLNAQEQLPGDDFIRVMPGEKLGDDKLGDDIEKVFFPSTTRPIPTFSAAFGSGEEVPPPGQMRFGQRQMGPRFYNASAQPFDGPLEVDTQTIPNPPAVYSPDSSSSSPTSGRGLIRHGGSPSQHSMTSFGSSTTDGTGPSVSENSIGQRRWVIE